MPNTLSYALCDLKLGDDNPIREHLSLIKGGTVPRDCGEYMC